MAGPCRTVRIPPGDNLGLHIAIEAAKPGEIVCAGGGSATGVFGVFGEVLASFAIEQQVAGLATSFAVRDTAQLAELNFPVFAAGKAIQGTRKCDVGEHQIPIRLGQGLIFPGDWLVGDEDGCVSVPHADLTAILSHARAKAEAEACAIALVREGKSTRVALSLPATAHPA